MGLSSEVFVMFLFIIGFPFFLYILKDGRLPQYKLFITAYLFLTCSNIFTVIETFWYETIFNFAEHLCITLAAVSLCTAVIRITFGGNRGEQSSGYGTAGGS